jgi:hypothetical protein
MIERPTDRYGRQRMSRGTARWVVVGLTALVLIVGVTVAIIASQRFGTNEVKGELGGYRLIDSETVEVTISVTRDDPARPVACIVRARALDGGETGRREVLVPPSSQATVQDSSARRRRCVRVRHRRSCLPGRARIIPRDNPPRNKRRTAIT